ncbi:glycosyl hydrolase family 18 protein [Oligoflexus tunisiensis]|uniref:glycosyl hydrolase family 18 protein n=1 Tax=Oligoflexus tunisiensis TaxID=708132 RepID=UPI00114D2834|nr:glycosyl hydrolase family 18 protein [Oligoflexus tunisiensis]
MKKWFMSTVLAACLGSGSVAAEVGLYSLLADDADARYPSHADWQPELHRYQQEGFSTLYFTFIRPDTMSVPPAFTRLARSRGTNQPGAVPAGTRIIFAVGGIAYSTGINPWPWLTSPEAARSMAQRVARWSHEHGADGIDLDIEEGAGNDRRAGKNLVEFVRELKRLNPNFLVTLPVYGYPQVDAANTLVNAAFGPDGTDYGLVDSIGIMVYEGTMALDYIGNYAKIPGKDRWEGFPIQADVPKRKILLGLKGTASDATIRSMTTAVKAQNLGGVMAWYGSVLHQGQKALQYSTEWDSSRIQSGEWQQAKVQLSH